MKSFITHQFAGNYKVDRKYHAHLTKIIANTDLYTSVTDVPGAETIGSYVAGLNGKEFAYSLAGASNLVVGNVLQEPAENTGLENAAVATAAVAGQSYLNITNGSTTITSLAYQGGSLSVYTAGTIPICDEYTIMAVTGTLTNGGSMNVFLDRPLRFAVTTSATVNMKPNLYSGVIQMPATTPTGVAVGAAVYAITAAQYGYVQSRGPATVLSDGSTFAVGTAVGTPSGTAGAVTLYSDASKAQIVGVARQANASAHGIDILMNGF